MTSGISTSMVTSPTIHRGLRMDGHLYSRMHRAITNMGGSPCRRKHKEEDTK